MIIDEKFTLESPREEILSFLIDVPRMAACVPGVEGLRQVSDSSYEANLVIRIGPISARFTGTVEIDDSAAPDVIVATASGRDNTTGSIAQITFTADLVEAQEGVTEVRSTSDVSIRGRLGQFGTGVIAGTAREMVRSFATCAESVLGSGPVSSAKNPETSGVASLALRGFVANIRQLWEALRDRILGRPSQDSERS